MQRLQEEGDGPEVLDHGVEVQLPPVDPTLRPTVDILRGLPRELVALDGSHHRARPDIQAGVWLSLEELGVPPRPLLESLSQGRLITDVAAMVRDAEYQWYRKLVSPSYARFVREFARLRIALLPTFGLPDELDVAEEVLLEMLLRGPKRVHAIATDGANDADRQPNHGASRKGLRLGPIGKSPASFRRSINGIRQRFMPDVRRTVYGTLSPAVFSKALQERWAQYPHADVEHVREQAEKRAQPKAYALTAAFISAFFPTFGERTTAEHVRKAVTARKAR